MILLFPTISSVADPPKEETFFVRSFDKDKFNQAVKKKVRSGWVVHQMTSSFRKTLFGGLTTYFCELRRGAEKD
jgi:hypothetical protein